MTMMVSCALFSLAHPSSFLWPGTGALMHAMRSPCVRQCRRSKVAPTCIAGAHTNVRDPLIQVDKRVPSSLCVLLLKFYVFPATSSPPAPYLNVPTCHQCLVDKLDEGCATAVLVSVAGKKHEGLGPSIGTGNFTECLGHDQLIDKLLSLTRQSIH